MISLHMKMIHEKSLEKLHVFSFTIVTCVSSLHRIDLQGSQLCLLWLSVRAKSKQSKLVIPRFQLVACGRENFFFPKILESDEILKILKYST